MDKETIKEVHHYHYYPYPVYVSQPLRYQGVWHGILPPPIVDSNGYYQLTSTKTYTDTDRVVRYDSI